MFGACDEKEEGSVADGSASTVTPPPQEDTAASTSSQATTTTLALRRPIWLTDKEGYDFCRLCRTFATDGHLTSDRHRRKLDNFEQWGGVNNEYTDEWLQDGLHLQDTSSPPKFWGDPAHFEWRAGWWWCKLCWQWADGAHTQGQRHLKRAEWPEWFDYYYSSSDDMAAWREIVQKDGGARGASWEECRGGRQWSLLALGSGGVREVDTDNPWSANADGLPSDDPWANFSSRGDAPPANFATADPKPATGPSTAQVGKWQAAYSQEHDRIYFYNRTTKQRTWVLPEGAAMQPPA